MTFCIRLHQHGGPEVLQGENIELPPPAAGEARICQHAIGLNFIDTYHRSGLYPLPLPSGLGQEGAGIVEAVGDGVTLVKPGDRVAYAGGPLGAYAEARNLPADRLLRLPDSIDFETAAAMMLQGLTAAYLLTRTFPLQSGQTVLVHAAAGGVGQILCQWAKLLGATVIGTVGSEEKIALARAAGCDRVINYRQSDFAPQVREMTAGAGVDVVYDGVGKDTFLGSLDSLQPLGMLVTFGNASGAVPAFDPLLLAQKGSLFITRPTLAHYTARREDLENLGAALFAVVGTGSLRIRIGQRYALQDAASAHRDLEARQTTGSTLLLP